MGSQEVHIIIHIEDSRVAQIPEKAKSTPKASDTIKSKDEFRRSIAETLWGRWMFRPFADGFNPYMNYLATKAADQAGQSVEIMSQEMEELNRSGRRLDFYKRTRGNIATPRDLTEVMIEKGLRLAERMGIDVETAKLYIENNVGILAEAWGLKSGNTSQLKAKVYQEELKIAS